MMNTPVVIPRLEDLPYKDSPPIQFTYQSSASLALGQYTWNDSPSAIIPNRPVLTGTLYYFRSFTLAADIEELDFTSNMPLSTNPIRFQMNLKSGSRVILFREPIYMVKFMQNFDYRLVWITRQDNDRIFASFNGVINQGPNLIGKTSITLKAIVSAQEIVDSRFINNFLKGYPYGE